MASSVKEAIKARVVYPNVQHRLDRCIPIKRALHSCLLGDENSQPNDSKDLKKDGEGCNAYRHSLWECRAEALSCTTQVASLRTCFDDPKSDEDCRSHQAAVGSCLSDNMKSFDVWRTKSRVKQMGVEGAIGQRKKTKKKNVKKKKDDAAV